MKRGCVGEISAFVRGGEPGLARLRQVLPSIFRHYMVSTRAAQAQILIACKLFPVEAGRVMTFQFDPCPNG